MNKNKKESKSIIEKMSNSFKLKNDNNKSQINRLMTELQHFKEQLEGERNKNKDIKSKMTDVHSIENLEEHVTFLKKINQEKDKKIDELKNSCKSSCENDPNIQNIKITGDANAQVINAYKEFIQRTKGEINMITNTLKEKNRKLQLDLNALQRIILDNELKYKESLDAMINVNKINYESKLSLCNAQIAQHARNATQANAYSVKMDKDMNTYIKKKEEQIRAVYQKQIDEMNKKIRVNEKIIADMERDIQDKNTIIQKLDSKIKTLESDKLQGNLLLQKYKNLFINIKNLPMDLIKQFASKMDSFEEHSQFLNNIINELNICYKNLQDAENKNKAQAISIQICDFKDKVMKLNEEILANKNINDVQGFIDMATVLHSELTSSEFAKHEDSMILEKYITRLISNLKNRSINIDHEVDKKNISQTVG
jgi:chromosome segregation ATPase